jgi:L-lactate dehydrogenase complex protein LldG
MNKSFVYNYLAKRDAALSRSEQELLREEIFELKKKALANLPEFISRAKSSLEKDGAQVFVVKNNAEAISKVQELTADAKVIAKSKSNTLDKLELDKVFGDRLFETDLGNYIVAKIGGESDHPVLPSIDLTAKNIAEKFSTKYSKDYPASARELVDILKKEIRENILRSDVGITGANAVTADGQIMLLENEGNISLISRLPQRHIAVCGAEKVVESYVDAAKIAKAAAVWGTGQSWPSYVSLIGGPSKTADIENELVTGVQGAQELYLILITADVDKKFGTELETMLYCIHCGACYDLCPTWNCLGQMPKVSDFERNFTCTLCDNCTLNCPAKINWQNITRICREQFSQEGRNSEHNQKMIEHIRKFGNPFGENIDSQTPDELFCC